MSLQKTFSKICLTTILTVVFIVNLQADTIVLKNGQVKQGTYKGGTDTAIQFEVNGVVENVALSEITTLTFSPRAAVVPPNPPAQQAKPVVANPSGVTMIPSGTTIMVRLDKDVGTATHPKGSTFTCSLENDLVVSGAVVAPKGSKVYGKILESIGGRRIGKQMIVGHFTELMVNNQLVPIVSQQVGAEGGRGGAARKVGAAALIGSAIDGSDGAAKGAAVMGGLTLLAPGNHIRIPKDTLVKFNLTADARL
jgi:hypothetical protein